MSDYVSPEEESARRSAYTWKHVASDLAYGSRLTIFEAARVVEEFKRGNVHPYDALPMMIRIYSDKINHREPGEIAREIVNLIRLERTLDERGVFRS